MPPFKTYVGYIASEVTAFGSPVVYLPLVVLFWRLGIADWRAAAMIFAVTEIVCAAWKLAWPVPRPAPRPPKTFFDRYDAGSFPSIHSARAAAAVTWLALVVPDRALIGLGIALALGVGWSRVYLRQHYVRDVLGGFAAGTLLTLLVARLW